MGQESGGFTLIELLVYMAIFAVVVIGFVGIFVTITQIQGNQSSQAEVESQSQFLMQKIQYYVSQSSLIDMPEDQATTTLTLRMADTSQDPTTISLSNGTVYLQQGLNGTPQALSSNQVSVSSLSFTKRSNPPAHDAVSVAMTVAFNTSNVQQEFSQMLQSSVARVSAATFDSSLVPSSTNTWTIGTNPGDWRSINGTVYFDTSGHVGIGTANPKSTLDVAGGVGVGAYGGSVAAPSNGLIVSGYVGIGTSSPTYALTVNSTANWNGFMLEDGSNYPFFAVNNASGGAQVGLSSGATREVTIDSNGVSYFNGGDVGIGTSTPSYNLDVGSGGATTARFGTQASDTIIVGGGSGKVTAGTYDPAYVIGGEGFATFLPGMTGEKEETAGTVILSRSAASGYEAVLDFGAAPQGSDLWLWRRVIDASGGFSYVSVYLTPSFDGRVWYQKEAARNRIVIHGTAAGEVSFQLIGRRFDWAQWPNQTGNTEGISVPN